MAEIKIRFSKMLMHDILLKNELVKETLPETENFTESNFWTFLDKYKEVIIKRDNVGKGFGIMKVKLLENGNYEARIEDESYIFPEKQELLAFVKNNTDGSPFIIQQHVPLAKIDNSPFDIRVIVQRKIGSKRWIVTGRYAKVAKMGFFKTNLAAGGSVLPVEEAIKRSSIQENIDISELITKIDKISIEAAKQACTTTQFKDWLIWGMDLGIDNNGKLFLFEANEVPGTKGFNSLSDRSMRKQIDRIKAYNRRIIKQNEKRMEQVRKNRYMGIMVNRGLYNRIPNAKGRLKTVLSLYEKAAEKNNVTLCYFVISSIDVEQKTLSGYIKGENGYSLQTIPVPDVIYRRAGYSKKYESLISNLLEDGKSIFNTRLFGSGKYKQFEIMSRNKDLSLHLPTTYVATEETVKMMMDRFNCLLIKPNSGSKGIGIMKLEKTNDKWCLFLSSENRKDNGWRKIFFKDNLPAVLINRLNNKKYIVQERIDLGTFQGAPFDIRVAVQKNILGQWEVAAVIAKVAKKDQFLTNIYQGGQNYKLDQILEENPTLDINQVNTRIHEFCLKAAEHYSSYRSNIADIGFDIALSKDGDIYFLELNPLPDHIGLTFKNNEIVNKEWENVFYKPIEYGRYLMLE